MFKLIIYIKYSGILITLIDWIDSWIIYDQIAYSTDKPRIMKKVFLICKILFTFKVSTYNITTLQMILEKCSENVMHIENIWKMSENELWVVITC